MLSNLCFPPGSRASDTEPEGKEYSKYPPGIVESLHHILGYNGHSINKKTHVHIEINTRGDIQQDYNYMGQINTNLDLLQNVILELDIYNVDFKTLSVYENPLIWLSGQDKIPNYTCVRERKSVAVPTGTTGITSAQIGTLLELYMFLQDANLEWFPRHIFAFAMSQESYNSYNAAHAVAQVFHDMLLPQTEEQVMVTGKEVVPSLAQIQFQNPVGDQVILDDNRKLEAEYDISHIWNFPDGLELKVKVGTYFPYDSHDHQLSLSEHMIEWAIGATKLPLFVGPLAGPACFSRMKHRSHMDGDMMIAGFFPLYTLGTDHGNRDASHHEANTVFVFKYYQLVLALAFAVEEINTFSNLLHNMTLGFDIYNADFRSWSAFENHFLWLSGQNKIPNYTCMEKNKFVAALEGTSGITSAEIGTLLELYRFPQLTFGAFDPALSDHGKFPSLYQMAPKDTSLAISMVSLMLHFSWNWVGLLISQDEKGLSILAELRGEMDKNRVCIAFEHMIPNSALTQVFNIMTIQNQINKSSANVLIIYGTKEYLLTLMIYIGQILITSKVWLLNSQCDLPIGRKYFMLGSFHVPLVFLYHHEDISGFTEFIKAVKPSKYPEDFYLGRLWFLSFNCSHSESDCVMWENCPHDASLEWLPGQIFDMSMSEESYNIYNAAYAVAQALHDMLLHETEEPTMDSQKGKVPSPAQLYTHCLVLHPFLKNIHFHNLAGEQVILDEDKKLQAEYDILNIWNFPEGLEFKVKIGKFSPYAPRGHQLSVSTDMIEWAMDTMEIPHSVCTQSCGPGLRKSPQEGEAVCCFDCIPCSQNEISNGTDMEQCMKCAGHQYANTEGTQCLPKAASFLAHGEPLGMALVCMALCLSTFTAVILGVFVKYQDTPIVKANNQALSYILLISLMFCFLCSLLFIGHPNSVNCILQQVTFAIVFTVAVSTVLAKTVTVVLAFKITSPGTRMRELLVSGAPNFIIPICTLIQLTLCGLWLGTSPPFVDIDAHSESGHVIILCNKGSLTAFYCVLGYLGSLALASFTVAFMARNLPDTFNEAKFLTFSMLVFCSVWLTFLPVYHSAKGKVIVAAEVFCILVSSAGLLGCIFVPKCYIILRPDKNYLHGFKDKMNTRKNKAFLY
ncbi:vomeronasal type-2 receptor 116-like [Perognathus longimembris pacificus]|uniref:vomeronasal type-2 receptor 116-like n=1 Tax=Perognathus longimembris pacificus TaxID=214514 RepID=UPI002018D6E0|nr:vomeronasal type-2 receptor 116-like [Perognathus longimembris pacificus]